jgi:hypothetical protein
MRGTPGNRVGYQRWLIVCGVAAAALAIGTGCGNVAGAPPAGAAATTPAAAPSSLDPTAADTKRVCAAIFQNITGGYSGIASDLGSMVGHLSENNKSAADASLDSARHKLTSLAAQVRTAAAPALDPGVRNAANQTASAWEAIAADPSLLPSVKTNDQLSPTIAKITGSAQPLTTACA